MFLSIRHAPLMREAIAHTVFSKDTGEEIPRVVWANDETGRYRQHLLNADGLHYTDGKGNAASKFLPGILS